MQFLCLTCFLLLHNLQNERRWPDFKEAAGAAQKIQIYLFRGGFEISFVICVSVYFFLFVLVFIFCFLVIFVSVLCKGLYVSLVFCWVWVWVVDILL